LRNFPIQEIAEVIDYIIFMTYDLHGQVSTVTSD
jgi:GH18 family chitinase